MKLFLALLHHYLHNLSKIKGKYAPSGVNYAQKSFMKFAECGDFIKLFVQSNYIDFGITSKNVKKVFFFITEEEEK